MGGVEDRESGRGARVVVVAGNLMEMAGTLRLVDAAALKGDSGRNPWATCNTWQSTSKLAALRAMAAAL